MAFENQISFFVVERKFVISPNKGLRNFFKTRGETSSKKEVSMGNSKKKEKEILMRLDREIFI